jgi:hypothetical protein
MIKPAESVEWRRSSRCGSNACVEVAEVNGTYLLRDAKDPDGAVLSLSTAEYSAFLSAVQAGEFDI